MSQQKCPQYCCQACEQGSRPAASCSHIVINKDLPKKKKKRKVSGGSGQAACSSAILSIFHGLDYVILQRSHSQRHTEEDADNEGRPDGWQEAGEQAAQAEENPYLLVSIQPIRRSDWSLSPTCKRLPANHNPIREETANRNWFTEQSWKDN